MVKQFSLIVNLAAAQSANSSQIVPNKYHTAKRLKQDYWLYVVLHCTSPTPSLNILNDPSTLEWQAIVKIEHYRLRQNSAKHPVELREEPPHYGSR